eukprot:354857-Chlamydomonas_euryale.AAC.37
MSVHGVSVPSHKCGRWCSPQHELSQVFVAPLLWCGPQLNCLPSLPVVFCTYPHKDLACANTAVLLQVLPCTRRGPHSWVECSYCHPGEKAARRCPQKYSYVPITCPAMKKDGACPQGDGCVFAHNIFEYWLHPAR